MAEYGIEIWDKQGNKVLRVTDRLTKILGQFSFTVVKNPRGYSSNSVTVTIPSDLNADNIWWAVVSYSKTDPRSGQLTVRMTKLPSNNIEFKAQDDNYAWIYAGSVSYTIIYGVF